MFIVPLMALLKCKKMRAFQELLARGWLQEKTVAMHKRIVFISHQWLSFNHPDPHRLQIRCLQKFVMQAIQGLVDLPYYWEWANDGKYLTMTGEMLQRAMPHALFWLDFSSMPQPGWKPKGKAKTAVEGAAGTDHRFTGDALGENLLKAVNSIPKYIECCTFAIVLAPDAVNIDLKTKANLWTWRQRGWCRMEYFALSLINNGIPTITISEVGIQYLRVSDGRNDSPIEGIFGCCQMNHTIGGRTIPCDSHKVRELASTMLFTLVGFFQTVATQKLYFFVVWIVVALHQPWWTRGPGAGANAITDGEADFADLIHHLRAEKLPLLFKVCGFDYLFITIASNRIAATRHLLEKRADPNSVMFWPFSRKWVTPMFMAMRYSEPEMVDLLVSFKAEVTWRPGLKLAMRWAEDPLSLGAAYHGNRDNIPAFCRHFPDYDKMPAFFCAFYEGKTDCVRALIDVRADVNGYHYHPYNKWARLENNWIFSIETWAQRLRLGLSGYEGLTPMHGAILFMGNRFCDPVELTRVMLDAKADVNLRTKVTGAARIRALSAAALARIGVRSKGMSRASEFSGLTPLHLALRMDFAWDKQAWRGINREVVQMLLDAKAQTDATNDMGLTPVELAVKTHISDENAISAMSTAVSGTNLEEEVDATISRTPSMLVKKRTSLSHDVQDEIDFALSVRNETLVEQRKSKKAEIDKALAAGVEGTQCTVSGGTTTIVAPAEWL